MAWTLTPTRILGSTTGDLIDDRLRALETALLDFLLGTAAETSGTGRKVAHVNGSGLVTDRLNYEGDASGVATLDASSKVVQNPASASVAAGKSTIPIANADGSLADAYLDRTVTPTANKTPKADGSNKLDNGWLKASATPTASLIPIANASGKLHSGWGGAASSLATLDANGCVVESRAVNDAPGAGYAWGDKFAGTAGGTLVFGDIVRQHTDGKWYAAQANASTCTKRLAMCITASANANDPIVLLRRGVAQFTSGSLNAGYTLYLSPSSAGDFTETCPSTAGQFMRIIGHSIASNKVDFDPSADWVEIQ